MRPRCLIIACVFACFAGLASAQTEWLTRSFDNSRDGANLSETTLTTANVRSSTFGKLFERVVDGQVYTQPLYAANLAIPNQGTHNVVFVATMNDSVYAFDADDPNASSPLWKDSFLSPGVTAVPYTDVAAAKDAYPLIGIVATPVIRRDQSGGGTIYLTAKTKEVVNGTTSYVYRLHALDILSGAERQGSPVVIQASVPSSASDAVNGVLSFNAKKHMQRPGLLLLNNTIYMAFASHTDRAPYHGWVLGYNADTLARTAVYCTTANTGYGGIWQSGQGLSADGAANIYAITGNATFDTSQSSYGDSFLKLSTLSGLSLADSFTPYNESDLNAADLDLGTSGAILIPGTNYILGGGKQGTLYVVNTASMGGHRTTDDGQIVQSWAAAKGHIHGSPVFWNGPNGLMMYVWSEYDKLKAYPFVNGLFNTTPSFQSAMSAPAGMPGGSLTVSANGSNAGSGIVWASLPLAGDANGATVRGVLRAFDASNLAELWNSRIFAARDDVGWHAKFNPPTVVNGKVYIASFGSDDGTDLPKLICYGLLPPPTMVPNAPIALTASAGNAQAFLSWSPTLTATSYKILRSTNALGPFAAVKTGATATSYIDGSLSNGTTYYYQVIATNAIGDSAPSNSASATPGSLIPVYKVNSGSGAFTPFAADNFFSVGAARVSTTSVDTSGVMDPAPMDVYRSERYGTFSYTFGSLTPGATYLVRLHFAETDWYLPGQRLIDVSLNGTNVLSGFDILGATGGCYEACVREFACQANGNGQIVVSFAPNANSPDRNARSGGIEILAASSSTPGAPNLLASPGNNSVSLRWNLVPGATSYNLYRATVSGQETSYLIGLSGSSYVDSNCVNGTPYYYQLHAVGASGEGPVSGEAIATPSPSSGFALSASPSTVSAPPNASAQTTVNVIGSNGFSGIVTLGVTGLPAGVTASYAPTTVTGSGSSTLTLNVGASVPAGSYPLTITGSSGAINASTGLTLNVSSSILPPPTNVTAGGGNTQVFLNWSAVQGAQSYNIRRSTHSNGPFDVVGNTTNLAFTDPGLSNGTRYYYAITTLNGSGESGLSTIVTAMPRSKMSVSLTADAYVQAGSSSSTNFGTATTLLVKRATNTGSSGLNRCTYLKIDLTAITSAPASALLTFHVDPSSSPRTSTPTIQVYNVVSTSWMETGITYANAPGLNASTFSSTGSLISSPAVTLGNSYYSFDLTSFVAANYGKVVTLQLMDPNIDGVLSAFSSRESSTPPVLQVSWAAP